MDDSRRGFLRLALGSAVAVGLLPATATAAPAAAAPLTAVPPGHIGIQLYTVRTLMTGDAQGTLNRLAEIGYSTVGVSGLYGHTPQAFRTMLDQAGLRAVLTHSSLDAVRGNWQRELDNARVLGVRYIVVPSLPESLQNVAGYQQVADEFTAAGQTARSAGLKFLYHNHGFDFRIVGGQPLYDILVSNTDPRYVNFELDLYWCVQGGQDPATYFERYPGRFPVYHVKDMAPNGGFEDVGYGTIDFKRLFRMHAQSGILEYVVEHDAPPVPLESARRSYDYLSTVRF